MRAKFLPTTELETPEIHENGWEMSWYLATSTIPQASSASSAIGGRNLFADVLENAQDVLRGTSVMTYTNPQTVASAKQALDGFAWLVCVE